MGGFERATTLEPSLELPEWTNKYRLHHVGIVVPSLEQTVAAYTGAFQFFETTLPFDDRVQRVQVAFVGVGPNTWLEFIEPVGLETPVTSFLQKTRGGYHHVAFEVADIDAAIQELEEKRGVIVCRPVKGFDGRRVAFLFPNLKPSLLTEFVGPIPLSSGRNNATESII